MNNVTDIGKSNLTPRQQAQAELDAEQRKQDVSRLKTKLRDLQNAKTIVANLEREIQDIEAAIAQGNEPA